MATLSIFSAPDRCIGERALALDQVGRSKNSFAVFNLQLSELICRFGQFCADCPDELEAGAVTSLQKLRVGASASLDSFSGNVDEASTGREDERQVRVRRRLTQIGVDHHDRVIDQPTRQSVVKFVIQGASCNSASVANQLDDFSQALLPVSNRLLPQPTLAALGSSCRPSVDRYRQRCRRDNCDDGPHGLHPRRPINPAANDFNRNAHSTNAVMILDAAA